MPNSTGAAPFQEERDELETIAESLARSPRLQKLLRFMGERYFRGDHDQLKEYNIAVELFGRQAGRFDPSSDAIARVEAHRLRKKLKEYYETEGRDHAVRISIPIGSYVPSFTHRASAERPVTDVPETAASQPPHPRAWPVTNRTTGYALFLWVMAAATIVMSMVAWAVRTHFRYGSTSSAQLSGPAKHEAVALPAESVSTPIRLIAGYNGPARLDSSGSLWQPDRYFDGGRHAGRQSSTTLRTSRPMLFTQWRNGEFSYNVPLNAGTYELHLYFVSSRAFQEADMEKSDTFSVYLNGKPILRNFDIEADALGRDVADERVFKDVHPAPDGKLHISFQGEQSLPFLNAIEILAGTPHAQLPIRIAVQPTPFTDQAGHFWEADNFYAGGQVTKTSRAISGTSDPSLFSSERYGHFTYAIPVDQTGRYTLILHFAELYFGPNSAGGGGVGSRIFNVTCNGVSLLKDFDIYKESGAFYAVTKTFQHLEPTAQGKLNLTFEPVVNNATISGIEIIDEPR